MAVGDDELAKTRERMHRINDMVQAQALKCHDHDLRLDLHDKQIEKLMYGTVTREQLDTAALALGVKLTNAVELMSFQIKTLAEDLAPIRKGIYWIITVVLGAVVLAGLAFILKKPLL